MNKSDLEDWLETRLIQTGLRGFVRQYRAIPNRKYLWDFAYPAAKVLIEVHGGTWMGGKSGHTSGAGVRRDCEKMNAATVAGWRVLAFTSDMIRDDEAVNVIADVLM